jgi:sulfur carrier protein ThiS
MRVTVRLHGEATRYLRNGRDVDDLEVADGSTVHAVLTQLGLSREEFWLHAVNGTVAPADTPLRPGDVLECIAPMSGG